tara:strand:+ start:3266 stop:4213 length:948 start_codon:yes stop_codon:yes gene_type:complete
MQDIMSLNLAESDTLRTSSSEGMRTAKNWEFRCCLDPEKMLAYDAFLKRVSKDKVIVDLGSGNGVMGYIALRYGAKKVICVDYNRHSIPTIKANMQEYIDDGRCEVLLLNAITDTLPFDEADIIIHEIFGHSIYDEYITDINLNLCKQGYLDKVYPKFVEWYKVYDKPCKTSKFAALHSTSNYSEVVNDFHKIHDERIEPLSVVGSAMTFLINDHSQAKREYLGTTRLDNLDLMSYVPKELEEIKYYPMNGPVPVTPDTHFFTWKAVLDDTSQEAYRGGGRQQSNWDYMPGPSGSKNRFIKSIRFGVNINPHVSI